MQPQSSAIPTYSTQTSNGGASDANTSGVAWAAIFAGAAAAAAISLILLELGMGLGLSAISPWSNRGVSSETIGVSTIIWLTFTQIIASSLGGYLAGRLRVKWAAVHNDEVYFRDTAHGMLAWAISTLGTAALLGTVISSILSGGAQLGGGMASGAMNAALSTVSRGNESGATGTGGNTGGINYFIDSLFRSDQPAAEDENLMHAEVSRIFLTDLKNGTLSEEDRKYIGRLVAKRTGLAQADAERRVSDVFARTETSLRNAEVAAKDAADKARKTAAASALWLFIALLCGAFFSSLAATYGGRQRDSSH